MQRAWQLANLNRSTTSESSRAKLGWAMSYAWKEAREGRTEHWDFLSPAHEAFSIEREITALEWGRGSGRYMPDHTCEIVALRQRLSGLHGATQGRAMS